jgi:tetratricopeptide (TPR) repeat protein
MKERRTNHPLTCASPEAARLYQEGVDRILGSQSAAADLLDRALAIEPGFTLAAVARYLVARDAREPDAERFRAVAEEAATRATEWEQSHVDVLIALAEQPAGAVDRARAHIQQVPGDLLVISQLAGYLFFYGGPDKQHLVLDLLESVGQTLGGDWAYLARLGFAASEHGDRRRGRRLLERALDANPAALYSIHGLAHVLHDEGDIEESAALLQSWLHDHESDARGGQMYGHVQWHLALKEWQMGDVAAGVRRFETYCLPENTSCGPVLTLADCGGFLLRQYLADARPRPLAASVKKLIDDVWGMIVHPFMALHVAGLYVSAADQDGLHRCRDAVANSSPGAYRDLSAPLVKAMTWFATGDYQGVGRLLATLSADQRVGVGGSNVERELIELVEKATRARLGDSVAARLH